MKNIPTHRRRGFTLIELLTVIAIIGILAAIIIPTVGKVRSVARASVSLSNMRQITPAFLTYAADNRGLIPRAAHGFDAGRPSSNNLLNPTRGFWHHELTPYVGGRLTNLNADGTIRARTAPAARFFIEPIWGSLLGYDQIEKAIAENWADIRIGYSMNNQLQYVNGLNVGQFSPSSSFNSRTRLDAYKEPSRTVIIGMGHYEGFTVDRNGIEQRAAFAPDGTGATVEHFRRIGAGSDGQGGNSGGFGFLDGSVRKLTPTEAAVYLRLRN